MLISGLLSGLGSGLGVSSQGFSLLADLDLTVSTDFEDLVAVGGDMMEFAEQDRLLVSDGGLEVGFAVGAPAHMHSLRVKMRRDLRVGCAGGVRPRGRTPRLGGCPHARGLVIRVCVMNPKKPNSAMRHVAKLKLYGKPRITTRVPGRGFGVSKFNRCLARGGRANDLPGVGYSLVRGVYDFPPLFGKIRRRSFYGVERPAETVTFVRRKLRRLVGCLGYEQVHSLPSLVQFQDPTTSAGGWGD